MSDEAPDVFVRQVREALARAGDPQRARAQQRYMKSALPFRGLARPVLKATLRPLLDDATDPFSDAATWERTIRTLWDQASYQEERYAALLLAAHRRSGPFRDVTALPLYHDLARSGAWWDLVDDIASRGVAPILRADPVRARPVVRAWATDDDLWVRRTAILAQLPAKAATDTQLLAHCLDHNLPGSLFGSEFFIRKTIGWALRQYAKTDPQWVLDYVADHELSPLSRREALKHLR